MGNKSSSSCGKISTGLENNKPYQPTPELLDNIEKRITKSLRVVQAQKNKPNVKDFRDEMVESEQELHRFNEDMGLQIGKTDLEVKLEEEEKENRCLKQEIKRLKTSIASKDQEIQNLNTRVENLQQDKTIQNLQSSDNSEEALQSGENVSDSNQENVVLRKPKMHHHAKEQVSTTVPPTKLIGPEFSNTLPKMSKRCNTTTAAPSARENISTSQDEIPKQSAIKQLKKAGSQSVSIDSVRVESVEENKLITQDAINDTPENDVPLTPSSGRIVSSDTPSLKTNKGSFEKTYTAPSSRYESGSKQFAKSFSNFQEQATTKAVQTPSSGSIVSSDTPWLKTDKNSSGKTVNQTYTAPSSRDESGSKKFAKTFSNFQEQATTKAVQTPSSGKIVSSDTPWLKTDKGSSGKTVNQTCTAPSSRDESGSKQYAKTFSNFQEQATTKTVGEISASTAASLTDGENYPSTSTPGSGVCNTVTKNEQTSQTTPIDVPETSVVEETLADVEARNNIIIAELTTANADLHSTVQALQAKSLEQEEKISSLIEQNEELTNRLSRIAGQKLLENNPAITDLSDPNRPLKLGEVYCEIYDNEWTDAFEELNEVGYSEDECIDTLRLTLLNAWQFCQRKSEDLLKKTSEAVDILFEEYKQIPHSLDIFGSSRGHLTVPRKSAELFGKILKSLDNEDIQLQRRWKPKALLDPRTSLRCSMKVETPDIVSTQLKHFRKEVADSVVPLVQRAYLSASWNSDCISAMKPFIMKCLFLGWMMVVQSPPLSFATCKPGESFNKDMYREYTKSGPKVEYVVWPTLLLHEGGPMIGKGVAQGMQTRV